MKVLSRKNIHKVIENVVKEEELFHSKELIDNMVTLIYHYLPTLATQNFSIAIVIDTNILFRAVLSIIKKGRSPLQKLLQCHFLDFYAPTYIKEELYEIIEREFPPKELSIQEGKEIANALIQDIKLLEPEKEMLEKAEEKMKNIDTKDAPFYAILIQVKAKLILSKDKGFSKAGIKREEEFNNLFKINNNITSGVFAIVLDDIMIPQFYLLITQIFEIIAKILMQILQIILNAIYELLKMLSQPENMEIFLLAILVIVALIVIIKRNKENIKEHINAFIENANGVIKNLLITFANIYEIHLGLTIVKKNVFETLQELEK